MKYSETEANNETRIITNTKNQCSNLSTTVMYNIYIHIYIYKYIYIYKIIYIVVKRSLVF